MSSSTESDESSDAVLVLIGYPGSGKSETGNTLIGTTAFKTEQETKYDFDDFPITIRDTSGFENISEFREIYNSLQYYEKRKVVFGLTIRVGRFEHGFTETIKSLFQEKKIGEHLKRKTFLIFTNVDELENEEDIYKDKFIEWLRKTKEIVLLIASLDLDYCVIQNRQRGDKRVHQATQLIEKMKRILQRDDQEEHWCPFVNDDNKPVKDIPCPRCVKNDDIFKDKEFVKKLHQEFTMTYCQAVGRVLKLQSTKKEKEKDKTRIIYKAFHEKESDMTNREANAVYYPMCSVM